MTYKELKYKSSPLPFSGQKRNMLKHFFEAVKTLTEENPPVYDVFGGSGLLSNACSEAGLTRVTYNDYDGFTERLNKIPYTREILEAINPVLLRYGKNKKIDAPDLITVSSRVLFSANYCQSIEELERATLWAKPVSKMPEAEEYLRGVKVVRKDYTELLSEAEDNAVLVLDPPYLSSDLTHYRKKEYWNFTRYFDILYAIENRRFIYFTSEKSQVAELLAWFEKERGIKSPLSGAELTEGVMDPTGFNMFKDQMYYRV